MQLDDSHMALLRLCPFTIAARKDGRSPADILRKLVRIQQLQQGSYISGKLEGSDHLFNTMRISLRRAGYEALGRDVPADVVS